MSAKIRHGVGKSDALDAQAIATAALGLDEARLRRPRVDEGVRQALRVLVASRDQMTQEKTMNVNALNALLRVHDLGIDARKPLTAAQIRRGLPLARTRRVPRAGRCPRRGRPTGSACPHPRRGLDR